MLTVFLLLVVLIVFAGLVVYVMNQRSRTIPEGHVALVQNMGRHSRIAFPGRLILRPGETDPLLLQTRRREVTLDIPDVVVKSGLRVTVNLAYALRLLPYRMTVDELYYSEVERETLQVKLIKSVLQELIADAPQPAKNKEPSLEDVFSPLYGKSAIKIMNDLKKQVMKHFEKHGIELTDDPFVIQFLDLPSEIVEAYQDLVNSDFDSTARSRFVQRIRAELPGISAEQLIPLAYNSKPEVRTIFMNGVFHPELFYAAGVYDVHPPTQPSFSTLTVTDNTTLQDPGDSDKLSHEPHQHQESSKSRRLKEEDMNMLKKP